MNHYYIMVRMKKVLLIFAHPDDETFSSSGTIVRLTRNGYDARLITATKGEEGMLGDPPLATRETIGKIREKELREAAKITGISKIYFLGFIDGTLQNIPQKKLETKILPIIKKEQPDIVITFEKNGISMHPDHKAVSKATTECFMEYMKTAKHHVRLYHVCLPATHVAIHHKAGFRYEYFGKMEGTPDHEISTKVNIQSVYKIKVSAMRRHRTQKKDYETLLKRNELISGDKHEHFKLIAENKLVV